MTKVMGINESAFADAFQMNMSEQELSELMASLMSTEQSSYDNNMKKFGWPITRSRQASTFTRRISKASKA